MWLFSMPIGWMADWLIESQRLSVKNVRRICNSIGHFGSALGKVENIQEDSLGWIPLCTFTFSENSNYWRESLMR